MLANKATPANIIAPNALVLDALKMMKTLNLSYVIVMDGDELEGIFSERNYSRNVALQGKSSATCPVQDVMTTGLTKVTTEHSVEECIQIILGSGTRYLPVMAGQELLGVITIHDILREALRSKEALFDSSLTDRLIEEGGIY
jgi:CBS domain-containing protein